MYSAGKTRGVLRGMPRELIGAMCWPTVGGREEHFVSEGGPGALICDQYSNT